MLERKHRLEPPGVTLRFPTSFSGVNREPLKGVCIGMTDRILILRRSSGFEVRSEEARREGGSEGQWPGSSRIPGGQDCSEQCLELVAGEEGGAVEIYSWEVSDCFGVESCRGQAHQPTGRIS